MGLGDGVSGFPGVWAFEEGFEGGEEALPAVGCALVGGLVVCGEAGVFHAEMGARVCGSEGEEDDGVEAEGAPGVGELRDGLDEEDACSG